MGEMVLMRGFRDLREVDQVHYARENSGVVIYTAEPIYVVRAQVWEFPAQTADIQGPPDRVENVVAACAVR